MQEESKSVVANATLLNSIDNPETRSNGIVNEIELKDTAIPEPVLQVNEDLQVDQGVLLGEEKKKKKGLFGRKKKGPSTDPFEPKV